MEKEERDRETERERERERETSLKREDAHIRTPVDGMTFYFIFFLLLCGQHKSLQTCCPRRILLQYVWIAHRACPKAGVYMLPVTQRFQGRSQKVPKTVVVW